MATDQKKPKRRSVKNTRRPLGEQQKTKKPSKPTKNTKAQKAPKPVKNSKTQKAPKSVKGTKAQKPPRPTKNTKAKTADKRPKKRRWPKVVLALVLLLVLVCAGLFSWDRWFRFDDAADLQGQWMYENAGSTVAVVIDEESIAFADDVAYEYQLNTQDKTILLSFGNLGSENIYRFSPDRNTLYIAEDAVDDWFISVKMLLNVSEVHEGFDLEKTTVLKRS